MVEPADHRALAALARDIWCEHYPAIISRDQIEYMLANGYNEPTLAAQQAAGTCFVIAHVGAVDAGFASVTPNGEHAGTAWLDKFYVRREQRGAGVGRALLDWAVETALAMQSQALCLRVNRHNKAAVETYRHAGFAIERADVKTIGQGFVMDDYIMRKPLASAG